MDKKYKFFSAARWIPTKFFGETRKELTQKKNGDIFIVNRFIKEQ